jgi:hypothetical protein
MLCLYFHAAAKFTSAGGVVLVCIVREAGPNWLDVTLGVADSGPGIAKESQRHVLRAFTTGDALPQEDTIGGAKSTGIGLRLADLIAHTITEPSLKPRQDGPVVRVGVEGGTLGESSLQLFKNGEVGLKITSPLDEQHEHCVPNGGPGAFIYFQSAIQRASDNAIARYRENPSGEPFQEIDFGAYVYEIEFSGTMKVLVVDDQRTMRQMVAMIYQKISVTYPGVTIDCYTALSGEQAIRMCREHRFHIITMDQQLSVDYCQTMRDEISMSQMPDEGIPNFVRFGMKIFFIVSSLWAALPFIPCASKQSVFVPTSIPQAPTKLPMLSCVKPTLRMISGCTTSSLEMGPCPVTRLSER